MFQNIPFKAQFLALRCESFAYKRKNNEGIGLFYQVFLKYRADGSLSLSYSY